jgi:hypothetical protein
MEHRAWAGILLGGACLLFSASVARAEEKTTLDAPATAPSGSHLRVECPGPSHEQFDGIRVAPAGSPDSYNAGPGAFTFNRPYAVVPLPEKPGEYELRFVQGGSARVLARRKLTVTPVTATLEAPATVVGGNKVPVTFTGPHNQFDKIGVVPAGAPDVADLGPYFAFVFNGNQAHVLTPDRPGEYEIRYVRGAGGTALARRKLTVTGAAATVHGPGTAVSGATISVAVTGPHAEYDRIGIVAAGAPDTATPGRYSSFTFGKNQVGVRIPEQPGAFEIRYFMGSTGRPLASEKLTITGTTASVQGPGKTPAGESFKVNWKGPANEYDHIVVVAKGAPEDKWVTSAFVFKRSPTSVLAPVAVGHYEIRYQTGETGTTLARDDLEVVPAKEEPGLLSVKAAENALSAGGAVEIILDASGSMLQKLGGERRIDIAKKTLTRLTAEVIPAGTPFALRVFGREPRSCQSDLDLPLRPLDPAVVGAKVGALVAKSHAKTPIAASLEKVASDLANVKGERLVILVTDGEETCGGNPWRTIQKLRSGGVNVRVNIVGFAVDDAKVAATFRQWSETGNGMYFDAQDAAGLNEGLAASVRPAFQVRDAKNQVVADGLAGGEAIPLLPGLYTVSLKGQKGHVQHVTVRPKQTTSVQF